MFWIEGYITNEQTDIVILSASLPPPVSSWDCHLSLIPVFQLSVPSWDEEFLLNAPSQLLNSQNEDFFI